MLEPQLVLQLSWRGLDLLPSRGRSARSRLSLGICLNNVALSRWRTRFEQRTFSRCGTHDHWWRVPCFHELRGCTLSDYACIRVGCRHACKLLTSISGPKVREHYVGWVRRKAQKRLVYWLCRWGSRRILYCIKIVKLICWSRVSTLSKSCKVKSDHRAKRYVSTVADRFVPVLSRKLTGLSFWCSD